MVKSKRGASEEKKKQNKTKNACCFSVVAPLVGDYDRDAGTTGLSELEDLKYSSEVKRQKNRRYGTPEPLVILRV